jgi:hypothetical protein
MSTCKAGIATLAAASSVLLLASPADAVPPSNDNFARAQTLQPVDPEAEPCSFEGDSDNFDATRQRAERGIMGQRAMKTVWFRWTVPQSGCAAEVTIDTFGSDFDTLLAVYETNRIATLGQGVVAEDDDALMTEQSQVSFAAVPGTTYRIQVDGRERPGTPVATGNILVQVTQ